MISGLLWIQSKLVKLRFDIRNYDTLNYHLVMATLEIDNEFIRWLDRMYSFPPNKEIRSISFKAVLFTANFSSQ